MSQVRLLSGELGFLFPSMLVSLTEKTKQKQKHLSVTSYSRPSNWLQTDRPGREDLIMGVARKFCLVKLALINTATQDQDYC